MGNVSVPRSYFVKTAVRDYNDPFRALIREFLQNSRDAGATEVDFNFHNHRLSVKDNGCGMTREIIETKLMALGETSKGVEHTGGFGVAKILLFFAHDSYAIYTKGLAVKGQGGSYTIEDRDPMNSRWDEPTMTQGVQAEITFSQEVISSTFSTEDLVRICEQEVRKSCLDMAVRVQGTLVPTENRKGRSVAEIGPGLALHKRRCDDSQHYASVRVNGLHMFQLYVGECKYILHVELSGYSTEYLTSNRDGLRGDWRRKVEKACQEFVLNTSQGNKTALKLYKGASSRFSEDSLKPLVDSVNDKVSALLSSDSDTGTISAEIHKLMDETLAERPELKDSVTKLLSNLHTKLENVSSIGSSGWQNITVIDAQLAHHYFVETNGNFRKLPQAWQPQNFKPSQTRLLELWSKIVGMVLVDAGKVGAEFNVGFLLDDGSEGDVALAKYRKRSDNTDLFLLNATKYGDEKRLPIKRKRRTELVLWLLDLAVHEVTHSCGNELHNETFMKKEVSIKQKALFRIKAYLSL
jgi:hypothetical protein